MIKLYLTRVLARLLVLTMALRGGHVELRGNIALLWKFLWRKVPKERS